MIIQTGTSATGIANVNEDFALRVFDTNGANPFFVNAVSGTIGAAANGCLYAQRLDPAAPNPGHIRSVRCWYRCIAGFTIPNTFRALRLRRYTGAVAAGGTAIASVGQKNPSGAASEFNAAAGGDVRIATTIVLTAPTVPDTLEVAERINLTDYGNVNNSFSWAWDFSTANGRGAIVIPAGSSLGIETTAAWDAGGTWELGVHVEWFEGRLQG